MTFWIIVGVVALLLFALAWWSSGRAKRHSGPTPSWDAAAQDRARHYEAYPHRPQDHNGGGGGLGGI